MRKKKTGEIRKLVYRISDIGDLLHPLSSEGFELLSAPFLSFLDLTYPLDSGKAPILLEITGKRVGEAQQKIIDDAIWRHYRLLMAWHGARLRSCLFKTLWFLCCTILSSLFLYIHKTEEVSMQILILPIWFFGYRLLTCPLQEYLPIWKEFSRSRRLASMKLMFSEEPQKELSPEILAEAWRETAENYHQAADGLRWRRLMRQLFKKDGTFCLALRCDSLEALLNPCSEKGSELISEELATLLFQAEGYLTPKIPAELLIQASVPLRPEEKAAFSAAYKNYEELRYAEARGDLRESRRKILGYSFGLFLAGLILYLYGRGRSIGLHEFFLIGISFFGDYLLEIVFLSHWEVKNAVRLRRKMLDLPIRFGEKEE